MKVFLVIADDIYYDAGESWVVGIFSTKERADTAILTDEVAYQMEYEAGQHHHCGTLVHVIYELTLDENNQEMLYLNGAA